MTPDGPRLPKLAFGALKAATGRSARVGARALAVVTDRLSLIYHVLVVVLSAAVAASLPLTLTVVAQSLLVYWAVIENEKIVLVGTEVAVALLLILGFGHVKTSWRNRRLAKTAQAAGMVQFRSRHRVLARRRTRKLKARQALMRDIMIIGSTGARTLADPTGDLHVAIHECRTAKIMLLDPESAGAVARARTIDDPAITVERLRDQVGRTIGVLRALGAAQARVRLKLYADPPIWKLAILGDYAWVQHYHPGLDAQALPEFMFVHGQSATGLYPALYQYFAARWNDPSIPEYDLTTGALIYRDGEGNVIRRERCD
ncbi:MAG: hypothetical protein HY615_14645 [Candidatus Rokubacteria bacterium]|nr:hypothetical protein [Candidatus Rokubacteria bacterium]